MTYGHVSKTGFRILAMSLALAGLGTAWAQNTPTAEPQPGQMKPMHDMKGMQGMMDNMHTMPATVDAVDQKTGIVDVTSSGMKLKVHFPPASLAALKAGDTITLHLGFTK